MNFWPPAPARWLPDLRALKGAIMELRRW